MSVYPSTYGGIDPSVVAQINATHQQAPAQAQGAYFQPTTLNPYSGLDAQNAAAQMAAINNAGPDVYDRAQTSVRDDRRALLDAIAGAGSAGKAEYQRQAEQSAASKQAMLSSAVADAQRRNADPGTIAALQQTISRPYDEAASARDASSANWSNLFAAIGGANDAYMTNYANSLPVMQAQARGDLATKFALTRADAQRQIAQSQQSSQVQLAQLALQQAQNDADIKRQNEAAARQQQMQLMEWGRQDEQQRLDNEYRQKQFDENVREFGMDYALKQATLAKSGSGSGGGSSGFFGTGYDKGELQAAMPGAVNSILAGFKQTYDPANITGSTLAKITGIDAAMRGMAAETVGTHLPNPLPPGVSGTLLPKYQSGLTINKGASADQERKMPAYSAAKQFVSGALLGDGDVLSELGLPDKPSSAQIKAAIMNYPTYAANKAAFDLAMSDYL